MIIIIDSDGLIGSLNPEDAHYALSNKILLLLAKGNAKIIYPATAIVETVTFFQGRMNKPEFAVKILELVNEDKLDIESIDINLLQKASKIMNLKSSKHNTLFDCIVAAVAEEYKADAIFSFDKFYKARGFKLASELK